MITPLSFPHIYTYAVFVVVIIPSHKLDVFLEEAFYLPSFVLVLLSAFPTCARYSKQDAEKESSGRSRRLPRFGLQQASPHLAYHSCIAHCKDCK